MLFKLNENSMNTIREKIDITQRAKNAIEKEGKNYQIDVEESQIKNLKFTKANFKKPKSEEEEKENFSLLPKKANKNLL